jgi:hypothetical protein
LLDQICDLLRKDGPGAIFLKLSALHNRSIGYSLAQTLRNELVLNDWFWKQNQDVGMKEIGFFVLPGYRI